MPLLHTLWAPNTLELLHKGGVRLRVTPVRPLSLPLPTHVAQSAAVHVADGVLHEQHQAPQGKECVGCNTQRWTNKTS
jgi:hypothetical protein